MYVCVYMWMYVHDICVYVCNYICKYICVYLCTFIYVCLCMWMCVYVYVHECVCVCACVYKGEYPDNLTKASLFSPTHLLTLPVSMVSHCRHQRKLEPCLVDLGFSMKSQEALCMCACSAKQGNWSSLGSAVWEVDKEYTPVQTKRAFLLLISDGARLCAVFPPPWTAALFCLSLFRNNFQNQPEGPNGCRWP